MPRFKYDPPDDTHEKSVGSEFLIGILGCVAAGAVEMGGLLIVAIFGPKSHHKAALVLICTILFVLSVCVLVLRGLHERRVPVSFIAGYSCVSIPVGLLIFEIATS